MATMHNIRIIARLDVKGSALVKGRRLEGLRPLGNPADYLAEYTKDLVDECCILNVVASLYRQNHNLNLLKTCVSGNFIPLSAGGGVRNCDDIRNIMLNGADRVSINTHALINPDFINRAVDTFGSSCIQLLIEARRNKNGVWTTYFNSGRETTEVSVEEWIEEAQIRKVGEIMVIDVERDGTAEGFNIDLYNRLKSNCDVPMIASGGAGTIQDCLDIAPIVDGICLSSMLHYCIFKRVNNLKQGLTDFSFSPRQQLLHPKRLQCCTVTNLKNALNEAGYDIRMR